MRRYAMIFVVIATGLVWGLTAWRVAAMTGRLGSVRLTWSHLVRPSAHVSWSPNSEHYVFNDRGSLVIPPNGTAQFLLIPPPHFSGGIVSVASSGPVDITGEYRQANDVPSTVSAARKFTWSELSRFPGGHRLTITNLSGQIVTVKKILLTAQP